MHVHPRVIELFTVARTEGATHYDGDAWHGVYKHPRFYRVQGGRIEVAEVPFFGGVFVWAPWSNGLPASAWPFTRP